ncbi:alpha/beta fold hydrolase [Streptacidiphilus monticola]|uniref:Alpha/beta fold hydrolase n=1 Tax=Streptacidiphilus monticola TaxID=2161674 RepID=A0ABW1G1W5_9ACTN
MTRAVPAPTTSAAQRAEVTVAGIPGVAVVYERRGSGEPLLLLHGIGHHRQAWEPVIDRLAVERDVIWVDLPGFGESPAAPEGVPYVIDSYAEGLAAFCEQIGAPRPHVAGNSLGGLVALRMGQLGAARSVTALSPAGFWNRAERAWGFTVLALMRRGALVLPPALVARLSRSAFGRFLLTSTIYHRPGLRAPEAVVAETAALRNGPAFEQVLAAGKADGLWHGDIPDVPVTVGWGSRDRILLRRQALRLKRQIPGARLVRLPGCGHVPMNDDPAAVARVILSGSSVSS